MLRLFTDPVVFNYVIMGLYTVNAMQFAVRGYWFDAWYWLGALTITGSVTFRPH